MTVSELIAELQKQLPNSEVEIFDPQMAESFPINGLEADADGKVTIYPEM